MTTAASPTTLSNEALDALRARLRGAVIRSADPDYDVRATFNAMHDGRPEVAIHCMGAADVVAGVNFAREHGLDARRPRRRALDRRPVGASRAAC